MQTSTVRFSLIVFLMMPFVVVAQKITVEQYIETYKDVAMREMRDYKIPASITLAQGILESGAGNSALAREAKNHFGIKCHKGWTGKTYTMDDDEKNECFRKYSDPEESYKDHSLFLTSRERYSKLFELDIMDYEGWAKGLKAAGYATNPKYAQLLIDRIKLYGLDKYDRIAMGLVSEDVPEELPEEEVAAEPQETVAEEQPGFELAFSPTDRTVFELVDMTPSGRFIYENNHVRFVFAKEGETPESVARDFGLSLKKLCDYNLIKYPDEAEFHSGDVIYLAPLRNMNWKAKHYVVAEGETLRDVALRFAVKPAKLLRRNKLSEGCHLKAGQKIRVGV